jgi:hypothetical protein
MRHRNPSLSASKQWTETYWPLHTPLKRETLHLNALSTEVLEGHRVKKCAFWREFLPQLGERWLGRVQIIVIFILRGERQTILLPAFSYR